MQSNLNTVIPTVLVGQIFGQIQFGLGRPNRNFGWPPRISDYVNDRLRQHLGQFSDAVSEFSNCRGSQGFRCGSVLTDCNRIIRN
jgi:hypothetical protein